MAPSTLLATSGDPSVVADAAGKENPPKSRTTNDSVTYLSTGNPCLDFFFHSLEHDHNLNPFLERAWDQDPLKALKLVGNLRGVRGTGNSNKRGFYAAAVWLHVTHPRTLAANVASFAELGSLKDWLKILSEIHRCYGDYFESDYDEFGRKLRSKEKRIENAKKALLEKFNAYPEFKFLHECVSDLFAQCLRSDMKLLESGDLGKISSAAKWCPSLGSEFDKSTLLWEAIAKKVFPREEYPEYQGVEEAHYGNGVRDRLREQVLLPLLKATQLPSDWRSVPYDKVSSKYMIAHKKKILKHDKIRFEKYLAGVKSGEAKMTPGEMLPHEILEASDDPVAELQWKSMVEEMGKLKNCLAIHDVTCHDGSGLALALLVSELNQGPWKGKLIALGDNPKLVLVQGESLSEKMEYLRKTIESDIRNSLHKVFDVLLQVAVEGKLRGEEMVKRVFVFSDMQFSNSSKSNDDDETDYEEIVRKFRENGYGDCIPEIVFWNVGNCSYRPTATPVLANQPAVALVSGHSKNLLSLFTEEKGAIVDPEAVMEAAISGEEYSRLILVD